MLIFFCAGLGLSVLLMLCLFFTVLPARFNEMALNFRLSVQARELRIFDLARRCKYADVRGEGINTAALRKSVYRAYVHVKTAAASGEITDAGCTLLDNFRKIFETAEEIDVRFDRLPHVNGVPRVYALCREIVECCGGYVSQDDMTECVRVFSEECALTFQEVSALKAAMKICVLEFISSLALRLIRMHERYAAAKKDALCGKVNVARLNSNAYVKALFEFSSNAVKNELIKLCAENGFTAAERADGYLRTVSVYDALGKNAVNTLYEIDSRFTPEFTLSLSKTYRILCDSESLKIAENTLETREHYLCIISETAKKQGRDETALTRELIARSERENIDFARLILPPVRGKKAALCLIFGNILLATALSAAAYLTLPAFKILGAILIFPAAICASHTALCTAISRCRTTRILPARSIEFIDKSIKVNVVCTRLISSVEEANEAAFNLETVACAHPDPRFSFTLLADLPSAKSLQTPEDNEILAALKAKFAGKTRFNLLVRKRSYNTEKDNFQGREKKRGALIDLNALILRGDASPFRVLIGKSYAAKYVIALDSDTRLNCGTQLVEIMEHENNADVNVLSLCARTTPASAQKTLFARLFCGGVGLSNYSSPHTNVYSDVFGMGNFMGKGIYRVAEFAASTENAFPDNAIVSHDFIEGAYAGCRNTSLTALDDFPTTHADFVTREQRWLRGDYQLIPWLFKPKNAQGERRKPPITALNKWHILLNLLRPLVSVLSFVLLLIAPFSRHATSLALLAASPYAVQPIITFLSGFSLKSTLKSLFYAGFQLITLPITAVMNAYSIMLTLVRLIRKKGLLEWKVFAHASNSGANFSLIALVSAAALGVVNLFFANSVIVYVLAAAFTLCVPVTHFLSEPIPTQKPTSELSDRLNLIALKSWNYFADCCTAENNFLPGDNYSENYGKGFCRRTSPTNIGMAIVSAFAAKQLNIISDVQADEFVSSVLSAVEKLPKWKGHLYNWYDVKTLSVLPPRYVSSVDSGNFVTALMLAKSFGARIAARADALIKATDFAALYDEKRGLLHVGYDESTHRFDGHYDLVASEAAMTYLVAIGLGQIPASSWSNLSHRLTRACGNTLLSWTGGAFEYLLTPQFFFFSPLTEYGKTAKNSVRAQIRYAKRKRMDYWGVSECQYAEEEDNGDYRYRAFGIPDVALCEYTSARVVAPYASLLALGVASKLVSANLAAMEEDGFIGKYGLIEAFDGVAVRSYMSHHLGMSLAAITNYLCDGVVVKTLAALPEINSVMPLLSRPVYEHRAPEKVRVVTRVKPQETYREVHALSARNTLALISSGEFRTLINECGKSYSMLGDVCLTRKSNTAGFAVHLGIDGVKTDICAERSAVFDSNGVTFTYENDDMLASVRASVHAVLPAEIRKVTLVNRSAITKTVTLSAMVEPTLIAHAHDRSHQAYSNLFIEVSANKACARAYRKKSGLCLALTALGVDKVTYGVSRAAYFGRVGASPERNSPVDPALTAQAELEILPGEQKCVTFVSVAAREQDKLSGIVERMRESQLASFVAAKCENEYAATLASVVSSHTGTQVAGLEGVGLDLTLPIRVIEIGSERNLARLEIELNTAKTLQNYQIYYNLVVIYRESHSYVAGVTNMINAAIERANIVGDNRRRIIALNELKFPHKAKKIKEQAIDPYAPDKAVNTDLLLVYNPYPAIKLPRPELTLKTGMGGFTQAGEYFIDLTDGLPPKPWSNVIATPSFGTLVTESGGGYTFVNNSRESKLTAWSNDVTLDVPSETVILGEKGRVWSISPSPIKRDAEYTALHGFGYTRFECGYNSVRARLTQFIGRTNAKYYLVELTNALAVKRTVDVVLAIDLVLGDFIDNTASVLCGNVDGSVLEVVNSLSGLSARVECSEPLKSHSFNRISLMNKRGEYVRTNELTELPGRSLVFAASVTLPPSGDAELTFSLSSEGEAHPEIAHKILDRAKAYYRNLSPISIRTGEKQLDLLYKWLPYQTLCSRFFARTGFYQAGGAIGFRDQLQDALTVMYIHPDLARKHILLSCAHQFTAGDVQHWWHPPYTGVRTRIMDDRLFLPIVVAEYINFTGDKSILSERVAYLKDIPIPPDAPSVYQAAQPTEHMGSVIEHCKRAIFSTEFNERGALMKGGDWNDAMDEAGKRGKGTTTFGTMLLYIAADKIYPFVTDNADRDHLVLLKVAMRSAIEQSWQGEWFSRCITDDGLILGNPHSKECKIDVLTQAFAAACGCIDPERVRLALSCAYDKLTDEQAKMIKLFDPPVKRTPNVGYIADYPEGVRENGGQYTHAAVWFIMAHYSVGEIERGYELLDMINPISHCRDASGVMRYKNEPYVMSADVYAGENRGEGGWSWYTGAASWTYKCITECLFGIRINGDVLTVKPNLPARIEHAEVRITHGDCIAVVEIDNSNIGGDWEMCVDGVTHHLPQVRLTSSLNARKITLRRARNKK